jgi:hypothetical protein
MKPDPEIDARLRAVLERQLQAVLLMPGEVLPVLPEQLRVCRIHLGLVVYDPALLDDLDIHRAVAEKRLSELLGYGLPGGPLSERLD